MIAQTLFIVLEMAEILSFVSAQQDQKGRKPFKALPF